MRNESRALIDMRLSEEPLRVHVDIEAIRRIFINLLKNAFQAIDENRDGEIIVETVATTAPDSSSVNRVAIVGVTDNGSGIPKELWSKIFVPSFSTKTSGTGLGLAIARKTIEDHGGSIGFETDVETGTTFWVELGLLDTHGESHSSG
jgi:signal transduction histidine kinase